MHLLIAVADDTVLVNFRRQNKFSPSEVSGGLRERRLLENFPTKKSTIIIDYYQLHYYLSLGMRQ